MAEQGDTKLDAVEFLEQQHQQIRQLFDDVKGSTTKKKADSFQSLVRFLAVHETAEEMLIHPEARRVETGDAIVEIRLAEENEAKQMLADLEKMGVQDSGFDAQLATFEQAVLDHAEHEEDDEFPLLYELHDEKVLARMTMQLKIAEAMAPTHPHPHGPDGAIGNMLVGPFVSIVDRVRDALRR
jgi:hemerythrin superfamily protein